MLLDITLSQETVDDYDRQGFFGRESMRARWTRDALAELERDPELILVTYFHPVSRREMICIRRPLFAR